MLAVIAFGWEGKDFYAKWMGTNDPDRVRELQGPCLNLFSPQSPLAPALLELVQAVLKDQAYVARLKRHYHMYRQKIEEPPNTSSSDPPGRAR